VRQSLIGPEIPGSLAITATIRARHSRLLRASQMPSTSAKHLDICTQPDREGHDDSRTGIETAAEILENRLELRDDVNQKKQKNDRGGADQKQGITDRRVDSLSHQFPARSILHDRAQHHFKLARCLTHANHGNMRRINNRGMTAQGIRKAFARGNRSTQPIGEIRKTLAGVAAECLERCLQRQSGTDQKRELAQKNRDVARTWCFHGASATAGQETRCCDLGIDRQVAKIFDAPQHLLAR
jgi:hypothetical protein